MPSFLDDMVKKGCTLDEVSGAPYDVITVKKGYKPDAAYAIFYESDEDRKRRQMRLKVTETVNAHRLKERKSLVIKVEIDAWRRKHDFDRDEVLVRDGRPLSPEEYTTYSLNEAQELKDAIFLSTSERNKNRMRRFMREIKRGRVNMQLTDDEHDIIKQFMKERAERALDAPQPTVSSSSIVQYCPDSPSDARVILGDGESEGTMSPALEDNNQQPSLTDTGIETPEQQSTPKGGNWEAGVINAGGSVLIGIGSSPGVDSPSPSQG